MLYLNRWTVFGRTYSLKSYECFMKENVTVRYFFGEEEVVVVFILRKVWKKYNERITNQVFSKSLCIRVFMCDIKLVKLYYSILNYDLLCFSETWNNTNVIRKLVHGHYFLYYVWFTKLYLRDQFVGRTTASLSTGRC